MFLLYPKYKVLQRVPGAGSHSKMDNSENWIEQQVAH